jgi:heme/copper-type cytochrome/quinol oxidase subunit 2
VRGLPADGARVGFRLHANAWLHTEGGRALLDSAAWPQVGRVLDQPEELRLPRSGFTRAAEDVGALRRLRVTKGVSLPADLPMHVVCGSKDVIHSWAIPGLGVKIDCIPGFNSHRRLLFRWRGLYWGQCMEVCGRYHHWMPLLIRVVHKDLFVSWCLAYLRALEAQPSTADLEAVAGTVTRGLALWLEAPDMPGYDIGL